ncbi:hypothetical protein [Pseudorhizobium flavum]|uniref:RAMA domain-containing protein n=1 Tax=Pseudorhizobium flavum TaxID=1335061 RepID=A0A7W9YTI3_9HYPH|nr:hypothetical protein [Pseudorhizobium flavum]MBB6178059.1 hypothetical protein [Pseudorhizobium flavum]CAD6615117.1 hypothetical protein RFYW14_02798 [Pseudorhizobium flavum]
MEKIEIDWDIHKMIENERQGFDEAPYLALRRLLNLPPPAQPETASEKTLAAGIPWTEDGVTVPHGSLARMEYLRGSQVYEGQFLDGRLVVEGQSFDTLSAAASALAVTKEGTKTNLNGWNYWKAKFPGESKWRALIEMRPKR